MWKVYQITTLDGKKYVGCTSNLSNRMGVHKYNEMEFYLKEHTLDVLLETDSYDEAALFEEKTIFELDLTNPSKGYNKRLGDHKRGFSEQTKKKMSDSQKRRTSVNPMLGKTHSEEAREKIRKKALARDKSTFEKNKTKTPEQIKKMHDGRDKYWEKHRGEARPPLKEETKKKISEKMKGKKTWLGKRHTEETKEKIRVAALLRAKKKKGVEIAKMNVQA